MKKPEKKKYEETPEVSRTQALHGKKNNKPWCLEFKVVNESFLNENSFYKYEGKVDEWVKDRWLNKLVSVDDALKQLNKLARSYSVHRRDKIPIKFHWKFAGKNFRLVNKDTEEIVYLGLTDTEVYAERTERNNTDGSSGGANEV